jgi:hypothetical protein
MRTLPALLVLLLSAVLVEAQEIRREPLLVTVPFEVLNPPDSPVEIAGGVVSPTQLGRQVFNVPMRVRNSRPLSDIVLRLGAGPFQHGIVTFRLRRREANARFGPDVPVDPTVWTPTPFARVAGDSEPDLPPLNRSTKVVITVEEVSDEAGNVIFANPDSRERLWDSITRGSR